MSVFYKANVFITIETVSLHIDESANFLEILSKLKRYRVLSTLILLYT